MVRRKKRLIFGIDYDGCCVENDFPEVGKELDGASATMRDLVANGHTLIIWTCRCNEHLLPVMQWCKDRGIECLINEDAPQTKNWLSPDNRKIFAHVYLDDRSFPAFTSWADVRRVFIDEYES